MDRVGIIHPPPGRGHCILRTEGESGFGMMDGPQWGMPDKNND